MIGIMWPRAALREPRAKCWAVENKVMGGSERPGESGSNMPRDRELPQDFRR
jgi:hypothetical protein